MNKTTLFMFFLIFADVGASAQLTSGDTDSMSTQASLDISFRPSVAVVIGILAVMFSLTFLLLVYTKYCHEVTPLDSRNRDETDEHDVLIPISRSRTSGVDKAVIESLPLFNFSALKGSKEGLECAVCLSKFEDTEVLRLLPTCKHAFHVNCVDKWLEDHSSCPLCRHKVDAEDALILKLSTSSRLLSQSPSSLDLRSDSNLLEIFVQREPSEHGSSRFSVGSSFRRSDKGKKDESLLQEVRLSEDEEDGDNEDGKHLDRFKHRIIISDIVYKSRWSDVNSTDLMFLNSEMLNVVSSQRFSSINSKNGSNDVSPSSDGLLKIKEEIELKRLFESKINRNLIPAAGSTSDSNHPQPQVMVNLNTSTNTSTSKSFVSSSKRSMSEITNFSRFGELGFKNRIKDQFITSSASDANGVKEQRMKSLWFPIARRTVQWIAGRERRSQQPQREKHDSVV